ncbi:MAG: hypothetical protein ACE5GW_09355, partial [Planctomycetota bacterium]
MLFASDRGGDQGFDLYWSLREGRGFSPPRAFPGPLNSVFHERSPSIAILPPGGLPGPSGAGESLLLYTSNRLTGLGDDHDLFIARGLLGGEWEAPERIEELSSAADERSAAIFPDGGGIIFLREGRDGIELLESSRLPGGGWSAPRPLEGITPPSTAARLRLEDGGTRLVIAAEEASWESRLRLLRLLPQPPAVTMPAWVLLALALLLLLLRLLAIRWHGLELLYRCLLLSLLIHILLWLWFHDRGIRAPAPGSGPPSEEAVIPMELAIDLSASEPVEVAEAAHGENVTVAERPAETPEEEAYRLTPRESAPQQPAATSPSLGAAAVDLPEIARQEETVPIDSPERRAEEAGSEEAELRRAEMATAARVEQAEAQMSAAQAEAAGSEYIGRQAAPAALPAPRRPSGEGRGVALADVTPPVMRPDLAPERSEAPPTPASRAPADVAELRDARAAGGREARAIEASGRESSPAEARWSRRARTRGGAARRPDSPGPAALVASPPTARAGNAPATPPASAPPVSAPAREISRTDAPAAGLREGGATGRRRERDGEVAAARPAAEAMSIGAPRPAARGRASPPAREPAVDLPATVARGAPSETSGSPSRRSEGGPERADGAEARIASPPPRADPAVVARGELPAAPEPRAPLRRERARGEASPRAREAARQGTEGEPAALARSSRRQGAPRELPIGEASLPAAPATRLTPPASRGPAGVAREQAAAGASSPTVTPKLPGPSAAR